MYSRRLSLYRLEASTFAGEDVFGSLSKLRHHALAQVKLRVTGCDLPLNARQHSGHIVRRTPPILQYIQTQLSRAVDVGVEHLRDEFDAGWFVGVLLFEVHDEAEGAVFKRGVGWADDDSVPGHYIVCDRGGGDTGWWVGLHSLEREYVSVC